MRGSGISVVLALPQPESETISAAARGIRPKPLSSGRLELRRHGRRLRRDRLCQPTPKTRGEVVCVAGRRTRRLFLLHVHGAMIASGRAGSKPPIGHFALRTV